MDAISADESRSGRETSEEESLNGSESNLRELTILQVDVWTKVHFIGHSLEDQSLFSP